MSEREDVSWL